MTRRWLLHGARALAIAGAAGYGWAVVWLTLLPGESQGGWGDGRPRVNWVPLRGIREQLGGPHNPGTAQYQLAGNSVMLVPLGVLLCMVLRRRSWRVAVVVSVGTAVAIEGLQWLLPIGRAVDVDDVLLNSLGALAGYLVTSTVLVRTPLGMGFLRGRPEA